MTVFDSLQAPQESDNLSWRMTSLASSEASHAAAAPQCKGSVPRPAWSFLWCTECDVGLITSETQCNLGMQALNILNIIRKSERNKIYLSCLYHVLWHPWSHLKPPGFIRLIYSSSPTISSVFSQLSDAMRRCDAELLLFRLPRLRGMVSKQRNDQLPVGMILEWDSWDRPKRKRDDPATATCGKVNWINCKSK